MAGLHRGVGGKVAHLPHPMKVIQGLPRAQGFGGIGIAGQQFHGQQGRMALVHMVLPYLKAQGLEHPYPAHPQHHLLFKPIGAVTAVEVMGDGAILFGVFGQLGIQQDHRNPPSLAAADHI